MQQERRNDKEHQKKQQEATGEAQKVINELQSYLDKPDGQPRKKNAAKQTIRPLMAVILDKAI